MLNVAVAEVGLQGAHSDDRDQSFQRIATSVTRVRDGRRWMLFLISVFSSFVKCGGSPSP
jgi:hypothetical protein